MFVLEYTKTRQVNSSKSIILRWTGCKWQNRKGSPTYPGRQKHMGTWLTARHSAFWPHTPGQGSAHLLRMQALSGAQSELTVHSGRHPSYGLPKKSGRQEQAPAPFCSRHTALLPQGDGEQGVTFSGTIGVARTITRTHIYMALCLS